MISNFDNPFVNGWAFGDDFDRVSAKVWTFTLLKLCRNLGKVHWQSLIVHRNLAKNFDIFTQNKWIFYRNRWKLTEFLKSVSHCTGACSFSPTTKSSSVGSKSSPISFPSFSAAARTNAAQKWWCSYISCSCAVFFFFLGLVTFLGLVSMICSTSTASDILLAEIWIACFLLLLLTSEVIPDFDAVPRFSFVLSFWNHFFSAAEAGHQPGNPHEGGRGEEHARVRLANRYRTRRTLTHSCSFLHTLGRTVLLLPRG